MIYYNDNDPFCCAWLKELMSDGLIPKGDIDDRSITDIAPSDLGGYVQCHFFAGIGGWAYSLRLAGWPDDRPVWTGSCPCQPFSVAGKCKGLDDERHLWPAFRWLIAQRKPSIVFGEQVASKDGRIWLSGVRSDLEAMGYAVGAADLCAAGVGAPHRRQRLFWMAHPHSERSRFEGIVKTKKAFMSWSRNEYEGLVQKILRVSVPTGRSGALSDGISNRVGILRGAGNAIVPQVAAEFIMAAAEVEKE